MSILVDISLDELFDGGAEAAERGDGTGLSLREAIGLVNNGALGPVTFDMALSGGTVAVTDSTIDIVADIVIDGDLNNDGTPDVTVEAGELSNFNTTLFDFSAAGVSFENADAILSVDTSAGIDFRPRTLNFNGDNITFSNSGSVLSNGVDDPAVGRANSAIAVSISETSNNFTLTNEATGVIQSLGRFGVQVDFPLMFSPSNTVINNAGLIQSTDDAIRIATGEINNSGIIRTTGTFQQNLNLQPGRTADAISAFGEYDPAFVPPSAGIVTINNAITGVIEGARSGAFLSGGGSVNNDGLITGEVAAIGSQGTFSSSFSGVTSLEVINTGTISRTTDLNYGFGTLDPAAIVSSRGFDVGRTMIENSGLIDSTDTVIRALSAATVNNLAGGSLIGDTDNVGDDAVAFRGEIIEDLFIQAFVNFRSAFLELEFISSQGAILVESTETFIGLAFQTPEGTFPLTNFQIPLAVLSVNAPPILPLIDIAASQASGNAVFVTGSEGANDYIFPTQIDVPYDNPDTGMTETLDVRFLDTTVTVVEGGGFIIELFTEILNEQGDFATIPIAGFNFDDIITNDGTIVGDIITGFGDDIVINNGALTGDVILGRGNDSIDASMGSTPLYAEGGRGDDTLIGGALNDTLVGGEGADSLVGNGGADTASYADAASAVTAELWRGFGRRGDANGDTYSGIENLIGSEFDDLLAGNGANNDISGLAGDDTIIAGGGSDILAGGAGADSLNGQGGTDLASYAGAAAGVSASLLTGGSAGDALGDQFAGIEGFLGSAFGDYFEGDSGANLIVSRGGDDTLEGGAGADNLQGGQGIDTASYATAPGGIVAQLFSGSGSGGDAAGDVFFGIENILGSDFADRISGNVAANVLNGAGGVDTIVGGGGNDTLIGGAAADFLFGQGGFDTASYDTAASAVTAELWRGFGTRGDANGDMYTDIENLIGSDFDDLLAGNGGPNAIFGGAGDDTIIAGGGNDTLGGGAGADVLNGQGGVDTIDYSDAAGPVTAELWRGFGTRGDANGDTYTAIENIIGSAFDDLLAGNGAANRIEGGEGDDIIVAGGANDTLIGGAGNDSLFGQGADDRFEFGTGDGADEITGFQTGAGSDDVIALSLGAAFDTFGEVQAAATQDGADVLIDFGGGDSIRLINTNVGDLAADDFIFI